MGSRTAPKTIEHLTAKPIIGLSLRGSEPDAASPVPPWSGLLIRLGRALAGGNEVGVQVFAPNERTAMLLRNRANLAKRIRYFFQAAEHLGSERMRVNPTTGAVQYLSALPELAAAGADTLVSSHTRLRLRRQLSAGRCKVLTWMPDDLVQSPEFGYSSRSVEVLSFYKELFVLPK
jgi:hypothetical protein